MKRLLSLLILLLSLCAIALADGASPLPGYTLRDSADEVRVYASPSNRANIVGYIIPGGRQEVAVLEDNGQWCYVRFTSIYGDTWGYVPRSAFEVAAAATPSPAPPSGTYTPGSSATIISAGQGYRLNLRTGPSAAYASTAKYYAGVEVILTGAVRDGYAQVSVEGATGWMDLRYLESEDAVLIETPVVTVDNSGSGANLRRGPGTSYGRIGWYRHGTQITVLGVTAENWYHVQMPDGVIGYMSAGLLSEEFPFLTGTDSDSPASSDLAVPGMVMYVNTFNAATQLHLRQSSSSTSRSLGAFWTGTPVTVISYTRTGWAYVQLGQSTGYMDANYLTAQAPVQCGKTFFVNNTGGTGLNLRQRPTASSALLEFLPNFTAITLLGDLPDGWSYVIYDGMDGYVLTHSIVAPR